MNFTSAICAELQALGSMAGELAALESAEQTHGEQVMPAFLALGAPPPFPPSLFLPDVPLWEEYLAAGAAPLCPPSSLSRDLRFLQECLGVGGGTV
jgi:hypothetical protein